MFVHWIIMTSPLRCCSSVFKNYLKMVIFLSIWLHSSFREMQGWVRKPINQVAVVTPTDRPKIAIIVHSNFSYYRFAFENFLLL